MIPQINGRPTRRCGPSPAGMLSRYHRGRRPDRLAYSGRRRVRDAWRPTRVAVGRLTLVAMTTPSTPITSGALRVSDADRESVAARIRDAAAEGRLTLAEADERQALAYAARTRDDLHPLTADLPQPPRIASRSGPLSLRARRRLGMHAGLVALLAAVMVTGWALGSAPWFWPAWPLFWLTVSLVVHHRRAERVGDHHGVHS